MESKKLAKKIADLILQKKGEDIKILDLRELTTVTDYFVICSTSTDVQNKAIADFSKAIELAPSKAVTYYNRGVVYYRKGERAKAIADFNRVVELSKDPALTQKAEDYLRRLGQ